MDHRPAAAHRRGRGRVEPSNWDGRSYRRLLPRLVRMVRRRPRGGRGAAALVEAPLSGRGAGDRRVRGSRQMGLAGLQRSIGPRACFRSVCGVGLRPDSRAIAGGRGGNHDHRLRGRLAHPRPVSREPDAHPGGLDLARGVGDWRLHALPPSVLSRAGGTSQAGTRPGGG